MGNFLRNIAKPVVIRYNIKMKNSDRHEEKVLLDLEITLLFGALFFIISRKLYIPFSRGICEW